MGDMITNAIKGFFQTIADQLFSFAIKCISAILDQIDQSLPIIKTWYAIFLAFATSLVVVIVLGRIITTLLKEADDTSDVTWANILMDALKSGASIPIMVFLQGFLGGNITNPLAKSMFTMSGRFTSKAILDTTSIPLKAGAAGASSAIHLGAWLIVLYLIFFAIVAVFFLIKMCIFFADIMWYNLAIPFTAVSIASETFDYGKQWWKKLIYLNISMLSQVLSLTICIYCFTNISKLGFIGFMGSIGFGWLVLHTPNVIQDFWQSTGVTKGGLTGAMRMLKTKLAIR